MLAVRADARVILDQEDDGHIIEMVKIGAKHFFAYYDAVSILSPNDCLLFIYRTRIHFYLFSTLDNTYK